MALLKSWQVVKITPISVIFYDFACSSVVCSYTHILYILYVVSQKLGRRLQYPTGLESPVVCKSIKL